MRGKVERIMPWWVFLIIIAAVMALVFFFLYRKGKKIQAQQAEQMEQMEAAKQSVTMLVIDKKMMRLKDAGLPQVVIDQTPKLMRRNKLPIVKAKVGPRIMTLVADSKIYDLIPVKKEIKAVVSGIYIMEVKGIRGPLEAPPQKKGFRAKIADRLGRAQSKAQKEIAAAEKNSSKKSCKKASGR